MNPTGGRSPCSPTREKRSGPHPPTPARRSSIRRRPQRPRRGERADETGPDRDAARPTEAAGSGSAPSPSRSSPGRTSAICSKRSERPARHSFNSGNDDHLLSVVTIYQLGLQHQGAAPPEPGNRHDRSRALLKRTASPRPHPSLQPLCYAAARLPCLPLRDRVLHRSQIRRPLPGSPPAHDRHNAQHHSRPQSPQASGRATAPNAPQPPRLRQGTESPGEHTPDLRSHSRMLHNLGWVLVERGPVSHKPSTIGRAYDHHGLGRRSAPKLLCRRSRGVR